MAAATATQLSQGKAVALLVALGRKDAGDWDVEKLAKVLKKVPGKVDSGDFSLPEDADDEVKETLDLVKSAVEADEEITIKAGKGKKAKGEKKEKGERKAPEIKRDAYGNREGSDSSKINTGLTSKPQTAEKIAEKVGLTEARVKDHLKYWHKHKPELFGMDEEGKFYSLLGGKSEGSEKKSKKKKEKTEE
jgi:hypothetical protein